MISPRSVDLPVGLCEALDLEPNEFKQMVRIPVLWQRRGLNPVQAECAEGEGQADTQGAQR